MADFNFTNFCCRAGGDNTNAGTLTGDNTEPGVAPSFEFVGGTWVNATRVFTLASGSTTGLAVGMFATVFTAGATETGFLGQISGLTANTITFNGTFTGTNPANGTYTVRVGGAWKGVRADGTTLFTATFPGVLAGIDPAHTGSPRVNYKNDQIYNVTANTNLGSSASQIHQGYTNTYGDGGKAIFDGGTSGASFVLLSAAASAPNTVWVDLIFQNNGATGNAAGVVSNSNGMFFWRCVFRNFRGHGSSCTIAAAYYECEAYACNQSGSANTAGFHNTGTAAYLRTISHHHTGAGSRGFYSNGQAAFKGCIAYKNNSDGFLLGSNLANSISRCDSYDNGGAGFTGIHGLIENSNALKNGGWGIDPMSISAGLLVLNCGFGSGSMANGSGTVRKDRNSCVVIEQNSITYTTGTTPWADPDNGDFDITSSQAKGQGRGRFLQTAPGQSGTDSTPDVGSGQGNSADAGGGSSGRRLALTIGLGL